MKNTLTGFQRPDGRWGIRNYVIVLSTVHCANTVAQQIAAQTGVAAVVHNKGCMESAPDHAATFKGLSRAGTHPNVFGVVIVGLGCEQTDAAALQAEITQSGKPVRYLTIQQQGGPLQAVKAGVEAVRELEALAAEQPRRPMPYSALVVGVQCGGSDWTSAISGNTTIGAMSDLLIAQGGSVLMSEVEGFMGSEHIVAEHAANVQVGLQILDMTDSLRHDFMAHNGGQSIADVNPTPGNKKGGITTLVEKSMGNVKKMGSAPIQGVLQIGEQVPYPGLWIVDNREEGPDTINLTGFAMAGAHMVAFSSGRGSPLGNAVTPTVKLTGNPERFEALAGLFDFNAGVALEQQSIQQTGEELTALVAEIACGRETRSEQNGNREYTIPK